ncbi:MAG: sulfite oxidase-like oxidoreductase [Inquilinaceae bacterium]
MTGTVDRDADQPPKGVNAKLIDSKRAWARDGRLLTGRTARPAPSALPPGQRRVETWPVLDIGIQPDIAPEDWRLTVDGLVDNPVDWDWATLLAQPTFNDVSDIHCVTAWSRFDNAWEGVSARHLLSVVRPRADARHVLFHAYDGYTTNLALDVFDDDDVLLAVKHDGRPIAREHGGPVRVVVPKVYFWKSAKWIQRIEFAAEDEPGFWEVRGYHNEADPWREERYR